MGNIAAVLLTALTIRGQTNLKNLQRGNSFRDINQSIFTLFCLISIFYTKRVPQALPTMMMIRRVM